MEGDVVKQFLNKIVGVLIEDCGKDSYIKGLLVSVTEQSLVLENLSGNRRAIALSEIKSIREVNGNEKNKMEI